MNEDCPVCGAEGAGPGDCGLYEPQDSGENDEELGEAVTGDELATPSNAPVLKNDSAMRASSTTQTESSVAKVGNVYYDDLAEALNNAGNQTCDILKDTSLSGNYEFSSWSNNQYPCR